MKLPIALVLAIVTAGIHAQEVAAPDPAGSELEQIQLMIHHAVETAAEGARLVTIGGTETETGRQAAARGWTLIGDAKRIIVEASAGEAMMRLHTIELSEQANATMIATHLLEQAASGYVSALEQLLAEQTAGGGESAQD